MAVTAPPSSARKRTMSTDAPVSPGEPKLSPVEGIKDASRYLRGTLPDELAAATDHFTEDAKQLLKFHGSYQQEDRDARKTRPKGAAAGKAYMFMIRLKLPGGKLTADQWLTIDDLAGKYANHTVRATTRQSIQFHGILKGDLKATIAGFNEALVTSLGGCGDVNRNVLACPAPTGDPARVQMQRLADEVAAVLAPHAGTAAYHEIWLNGEKQADPAAVPAAVAEPVYGKHYLPRKFKIAFALPEDNCTDILAQCLGFLAVVKDGEPAGYNVYVGGGQGQTNSRADTFAYLARPLGFVTPGEVVDMAVAVTKFYRDHGNRADRKRARLKYVVADWGIDKVRDVFRRDYWPTPLAPAVDAPITGLDLHHGWHPQADGNFFLGLSVENGRVKDAGDFRLRAGVRAVVAEVRCAVRLSAQQDLLLCDIPADRRGRVDAILADHGVKPAESLSTLRKWSMACPAIPTCPLAITESERALPAVIDQLEPGLIALGLAEEPISVRMTGCPNGCARPYQSDIGLVGRGGTKYTLYVGGDSYGRRLNTELQDSVPVEQLAPKLTALFTAYKEQRSDGELFGDYCDRVGLDTLKQVVGAG